MVLRTYTSVFIVFKISMWYFSFIQILYILLRGVIKKRIKFGNCLNRGSRHGILREHYSRKMSVRLGMICGIPPILTVEVNLLRVFHKTWHHFHKMACLRPICWMYIAYCGYKLSKHSNYFAEAGRMLILAHRRIIKNSMSEGERYRGETPISEPYSRWKGHLVGKI